MAKKIKDKKQEVNEKHIKLYDKTLNILEFLLNEFSQDIKPAEIDFLEVPKNTIATIDFIISAIGKVQKGQRLALGIDNDLPLNEEPEINIVEGLCKDKI